MFKIAILLSGAHGRGSTLINLADACTDGRIPGASVVKVIGTVAASVAIERAKAAGLSVSIVSPKREDYATCLLATIADVQPDLICLAGYMRRVPDEILAAYAHRIVNIHPALLPAFGGQGMYGEHVHLAVYDYGVKVTGCTVHFIDAEYDTGPIILQKTVAVASHDTPETIAAKVQAAERIAYPEAVKLIAEGRVKLDGRRVV